MIDNKDILDIMNNNFENGDQITDKYFDQLEFTSITWFNDYYKEKIYNNFIIVLFVYFRCYQLHLFILFIIIIININN